MEKYQNPAKPLLTSPKRDPAPELDAVAVDMHQHSVTRNSDSLKSLIGYLALIIVMSYSVFIYANCDGDIHSYTSSKANDAAAIFAFVKNIDAVKYLQGKNPYIYQTNQDELLEKEEIQSIYQAINRHSNRPWTPIQMSSEVDSVHVEAHQKSKYQTMPNYVVDADNPNISSKNDEKVRVLNRLEDYLLKHKKLPYIPDTFDVRQKWYTCPMPIRDQGMCGSCFSFGSTSAISDRLCIQTKASNQLIMSANDVGCMDEYAKNASDSICNGGIAIDVYNYMKTDGLTSGGKWESFEGCKPYTIPLSLEHGTGAHGKPETPICELNCTNKHYNMTYKDDKVFLKDVYYLPFRDVEAIMYEIMTEGPVTTCFNVMTDFPFYRKGVYVATNKNCSGGHCVEVMGWGTDEESGLPYWLAKNSWGSTWLNGYFKIIRGTNECGFEAQMMAGMIDLDRLPNYPEKLYHK